MRSNFFYGILIGLIVGCLVGFLIFKQPQQGSQTTAQNPSANPLQATPTLQTEYVCPCKSWSTKTLPAPEWRPEFKKPDLKMDFHGKISLKWRPVDGSRYYILYVQDKKGREILTKKTTSEGFTIENGVPLPDGVAEDTVLISVAAANANREPGHRSEKLQVLARAPVSTVAPRIKDIKVEE